MQVLANTRVPASQISLHYHVGFCYLMTRRYNDTLRIFANIIVYIQKAREHFPPDSYQLKQVCTYLHVYLVSYAELLHGTFLAVCTLSCNV